MQYTQHAGLPDPDEASAAHSRRVVEYIAGKIREAGANISFAEFMQHALYAPGLGYYAAGSTKFGEAGDFVTAPEVSRIFGSVVARQCAEVLDQPAGPIDPDVMVLSVHDARGRKPLAMFANYALHYVGGVPEGCVSADYFGEFARLMPARLRTNEDFVAMMSNGTSGDINNINFRKSLFFVEYYVSNQECVFTFNQLRSTGVFYSCQFA